MSADWVCWKCGAELVDLIFPLSRREECKACGAEQHVCKLCKFYNPSVEDACTEDRAERVVDKERANFCDYFDPKSLAWENKSNTQDEEARAQLAELFGDAPADKPSEPVDKDAAQRAWDELFGDD